MIFLSHSWLNKPAAHKVVEALATEGLPCWLDDQQLAEGRELRAALRSAISQSDIFLYFVSEAANNSKWVQDELQYALALEHEGRLLIVPVRLTGNEDQMPSLLCGRVYRSLDPTTGGAARLAHSLQDLGGCNSLPKGSRLSVTIRLEKHKIVHTLRTAREFSSNSDISVLMLNSGYDALDTLYWNVADVESPDVSGTSADLECAANIVDFIHRQSRKIIKEVRLICNRFVSTDTSDDYCDYFDAAHERVLRVLLNRLQWNIVYLGCLRSGQGIDEKFAQKRHLQQPFEGSVCDFVSQEKYIGKANVPKHEHPLPENMKELIPWGMIDPFSCILGQDVGLLVGDLVALRFLAEILPTTEMPPPRSLTYGLA